ncbi:4'-phosphopantetheinyl transferase [Cupriavidus sp. SW-Y-13]|uniref:4'-phosphopantetheinyl transferase family protein n=1 Tax=Cupriavidus sp. SW-Y-13 TaxID=2653854 RepID=UPI00136655CE|nr:4'-phosphopantetheinyl transferase superfamily protein [Cupriavidus sp. SW-Y-13]MWL87195.1 4'-phosphopantetheinyl transferase superfamily protein [Cupriavidus sp. SW-Y-13]
MNNAVCGFDSETLRAGLGLPATVSMHAVTWRSDDASAFANEPLPASLAAASPRRRTQFRAGRHCARHALVHAGAGAVTPARDDEGLPVWPVGWIGSISHTTDRAVALAAAVAQVGELGAVGIDVEQWLAPDRAEEIAAMVALPEDIAALAAGLGRTRADAVTLLFSAKESLYKALFPTVRRFFDFEAARLAGCAPGVLELALTCDWHARWPVGTLFEVRFAATPEAVVTAVWVED